MLLKASVFRVCYRTGQHLSPWNSGLFNSQVSLETLSQQSSWREICSDIPAARFAQSSFKVHFFQNVDFVLCEVSHHFSDVSVWKHRPSDKMLLQSMLANKALESRFREISAKTSMTVTEKLGLDETEIPFSGKVNFKINGCSWNWRSSGSFTSPHTTSPLAP